MLETIRHDAVLELRLARPPANALDPALVRALREAVQAAPAGGARAIVLSGRPGLFSAGLDVPALLALDRAGMRAFWADFNGVMAALGRSPLPVAAAIGGHSPAGGAVLALFCDWRVMARGAYRIGLNEVQVGLSVPAAIQFALRRLLGAHRAERLLVAGAMIESDEAHRIGFVDELADADAVVARAIEWCRAHLALPPEAMAETRRIARADLHAALDDAQRADDSAFLERWFSDETQTTLRALVARLKAKA
ncbi:MAG: enoyl-CoA hydratase/isomerase family protein [Xanthomonadaceae bacterium]|jgi:enoyl-CoA hydratase/carnithine racemase|nr:enoyl-CoA hydratase/isomerase family protein [Xanthomonadaceae bacterium]